jgi:hypothetical protein
MYPIHLPDGFPAITTPQPLKHTVHITPYCGLPGTEVHVLLPNGYGLGLITGRCSSGVNTVEAYPIRHDGDPDSWGYAHGALLGLPDEFPVKGWADATWVSAALLTLAALPARHHKTTEV